MISDNLKVVTQRISKSCEKSGRNLSDVKLICVTKEASVDETREALKSGVTDIGENRVQDGVSKYAAIGGKVTWHLIGHLQTNKARDAVRIFSLIHSVDSIRLAREIDKEAKKIQKTQDVLIQVNTSGEKSKFGIAPEDLEAFYKEVLLYPNINILGLMTIAPEVENAEEVRPYFRRLRELKEKIGCSELSMGMSGDFEVAIEEGATMVRIGRAIFKK